MFEKKTERGRTSGAIALNAQHQIITGDLLRKARKNLLRSPATVYIYRIKQLYLQ